MAKKIVFSLVLCMTFSAYAAVNFPYPQQKSYGNGTINTTVANASANLKSKFTSFLSSHYEESGNLARIKFDQTQYTVSEGIGYGMIMMVYFSDNSKSYKDEFDRLWAYYNKFTNTNGLMNWKINGFSGVYYNSSTDNGNNAASDAEYDVAFALVMAYYQFGDQKYLTDAKALIQKIRLLEISSNNLHKPGDMWESVRNPSYVSPAAFEIFKEIEPSQATKWNNVISANYTLLKNNQSKSSVGLPSDWCTDNGSLSSHNGKTVFGYDASRAPWRWAWANAWYGHADAKTLLSNLVTWVSSQTPSNVKGEIQLNGTMGSANNSTFVGPLTNVLSYSSTYQSIMNSYWTTLIGLNDASYFNKALQILTGLLATGNMPNLKALSEGGGGSSSGSGGSGSSSSGSGGPNETLLTDFEGWGTDPENPNYNFSRLGTPFYVYKVDDAKIANPYQTGSTTEYNAITNSGDSHGRVAWLKEGFNVGTKTTTPSSNGTVAIGVNIPLGALTGCTAFKYDYKGPAHSFYPNQRTHDGDSTTNGKKGDWNQPNAGASASSSWTTKTVNVSTDLMPSWGSASTWVGANDIHKLTWEIRATGSTASQNSTQSLMIDNIKCIGANLTLPTPPSPSSSSGANSSNSVGSSSSLNTGSSSSEADSGDSSSSDEDTPILTLPQIGLSNSAIAFKNGINLAVKSNAVVQVFGLKGNSMRKFSFSNGVYSVSFSDLPKGLYIVKVSFGSEKRILRVLVN